MKDVKVESLGTTSPFCGYLRGYLRDFDPDGHVPSDDHDVRSVSFKQGEGDGQQHLRSARKQKTLQNPALEITRFALTPFCGNFPTGFFDAQAKFVPTVAAHKLLKVIGHVTPHTIIAFVAVSFSSG